MKFAKAKKQVLELKNWKKLLREIEDNKKYNKNKNEK